jgi:hypothetical protein
MRQLLTRQSPHERTHRTTARPPPVRSDTVNDHGSGDPWYSAHCARIDATVVVLLGLPVLAVYALILCAAPTLAAIVAAFTGIVTLPIIGPYVVIRFVTRWLG